MKITHVLFLGFLVTAAAAQQRNPTTGVPGTSTGRPNGMPDVTMGGPDDRQPVFDARMENQRARMRNDDRQKKIVEDTEKLLSLASQLKEEVDKSDKNTLSITVIKKAEEIEKLAKSVKERMKG
ncbi:hypothetical protein [Terriglobus tenax]|uniref:hypothetical protein n=1 Tax=Terriglobus tenax TaxID=1111115 RepID=UPI0021E03294|nr:hypothetical protein [Terriglobus tenax]